MAIKWVQRPFTVTASQTTSATLSEETGTSTDGRIIAVRTVTDDGAGNFADGLGSVNYSGRQVQLKVVSHDRSTTSYQSDYEDASEFERAIADGGATGSSQSRKGGKRGTATVGEELLAGASLRVRYRTGAGAPRSVTRSYTPGAVTLDLCPYTSDRIVPGSVMFRWMGHTYQDFEGIVYRDRTATSPGIDSGRIDYAGGIATMTDWVVGGSGPADLQLMSLWTRKGQWTTASLFFNTGAAPLRPGPGGFVLSVLDTRGQTLTANVDAQGFITGAHMRGRVEFARGGVELQFGDYVEDASLTPEEKTQWWYDSADIGAVHPGQIWRPWPVDPTTLRYAAVAFVYLPVDVSLMGIDPAALPADGRVAFARPGDTCVVGVNHGGAGFAPSVGMTYNVGHQRLSFVQVLDDDTGAEIHGGYTADLDAGTVTFDDLNGYPPRVRIVGRTEVYRQIAEVRIDGRVRLTQPVGAGFDVGAVFSTALRQGDRFARVRRVWDQHNWDGTTWHDGLDPARGPAVGSYDTTTAPIEVNNRGAITERWALRLRSDASTFDLIGQHLGQIGSGSINADFSPMNPAAGVPYFTLRAQGWGGGWLAGNTLFIDTVGAEAPIDVVRCVQPSSPVGLDDSCWIVQRGDVDRPPGTSF